MEFVCDNCGDVFEAEPDRIDQNPIALSETVGHAMCVCGGDSWELPEEEHDEGEPPREFWTDVLLDLVDEFDRRAEALDRV